MRIQVLNQKAWPKHKQLQRKHNGKIETYKPIIDGESIYFDLPDDYAEHLLDVSPKLFGPVLIVKAGAVDKDDLTEPGEVRPVAINELSYNELQTLYTEKTGDTGVGIKKAVLIEKLEALAADD